MENLRAFTTCIGSFQVKKPHHQPPSLGQGPLANEKEAFEARSKSYREILPFVGTVHYILEA